MQDERFTDKQVGAIIQRATELHEQAGGDSRLSLADVERIATEMGLPASVVQAAALEVGSGTGTREPGLFTIPSLEASAALSGPVDEERWAQILLQVRKHMGGGGEVDASGGVYYWNRTVYDMGSEISRNDATVRSGEDVSTIELRRTGIPVLRVIAQIGGTLAGGALAAAALSAGDVGLIGIAGTAAGGLAGFGAARAMLAASARRQVASLSDLARSIAAAIPPTTAREVDRNRSGSGELAARTAEPTIELDGDLDDADAHVSSQGTSGRERLRS